VSETISTSILTTATIILAVAVATAFLSFVPELNSTISSVAYTNVEKLKTSFKITFVSVNSSDQTLLIWLKNVGSTVIMVGPSTDIFLWNSTFLSNPTDWEANILNGEDEKWSPHETAMLTVNGTSQLNGEYHLKVVIHNGVEEQYDFSI